MELVAMGFLMGVIFSMIVFAGGVLYGYYYGNLGRDELYSDISSPVINSGSVRRSAKTSRPHRQDKEKD